MELKMGETIRELRKEKGISQEQLGAVLGVSVQAVSKWETQNSLPDIGLLPDLAAYFHISMDRLFFGAQGINVEWGQLPNDHKLRVVQFLGNKLLTKNEYDQDRKIPLELPEAGTKIEVEIWGSAELHGDVEGNVHAGAGISCGNVLGDASAGAGISCGDVEGNVSAGASVSCGDVKGEVSAGSGINCGDVTGDLSAGTHVSCGDVGGNVDAGTNLTCGQVQGIASAGGGIECANIG